ncbi:MAG TPA: HNH endonuclease signature motif containing protein [Candidatus Paceibacterota bacterium]|nr:HNH endonuclease signature motif containing protein [Candidatus Paceibacterota bacterium]
MVRRKIRKTEIKKERNPKKVKKVLEEKGYKSGKLPKGKELHHIKPISEGGKTMPRNTRIISKTKHKKIHKNRVKKGKI